MTDRTRPTGRGDGGYLYRRVTAVGLIFAVIVAGGCSDTAGSQRTDPPDPTTPAADPPPTTPAVPEVTGVTQVLATGLSVPWDIDFLPDGTALVTERTTGRILAVGPGLDGDLLRVREVTTIAVDNTGEGGLLGLAVSPRYADDETIYIYYSTPEDNRIARLRPGEQPEPILTGIPSAGNHNGGQLAFGPRDGYLYASTGDAGRPERSQDRQSLAGKILRMTPDGDPAPGNPFGNHVWAYGLRNVQGLAWDGSGRLWATEFGDQTWDEINLIEGGNNYGWPVVEGPGDGPYTQPAVSWPPPEAACSGAAVVGVTLVAACLRGQRLWLMEVTESGTILGAARPLLEEEYGRLRAAVVAPDGSLWITTSNRDNRLQGGPRAGDDRIIRVAVTAGGDGDSRDPSQGPSPGGTAPGGPGEAAGSET